MNWEGFLRSLSSDLWVGVGWLFVIAIIYGLASFAVKNVIDSVEERSSVLKVARSAVAILVLLVVVTLFGRAASVAFANRVPRQDIDKNPVYEQINSHGQKEEGRR